MSNKLWKVLLASPAFLGMGIASSAIAADAPSVEALEVTQESVELAQVTSVDQLTDVLPTDWAYTALQNLIANYGCIEGYPNRTFRGQQPMTRFEFAAGLNACLDAIVFALQGGGVSESDLATIQRLQEEFAAELATLRGRVDALEAEVSELREQQFSTTTKLRAQVDANLVVPFDSIELPEDFDPVTGEFSNFDDSDNFTSFNARARLNFDASFTGDDRLRVRLQARDDDFGALPAGGGLANAGSGGLNVTVDDLYYSFGVGNSLDFIIAANSVQTDDFVTSTIVPFDGPSVADPGGPVAYDFDMGGGGFGAGFSFSLGDSFVIDAGYSADQGGSNNPNAGGIMGANEQSYIIQGSYLSDGFLDAGVAYLHGNDGGDNEFTDTFMGLLNLDFGTFFVAGYFAWHDQDGNDDTSFQIGAGFDDLLIEGSEFGVYYADLARYEGNPYMIEGYWGIPVNQYLTLTPAIIYGDLDLDGISSDENFYGALRATFKF